MALLAHSCRVAGWLPQRGFGAAAAARQSYAAGALCKAPPWRLAGCQRSPFIKRQPHTHVFGERPIS